MKMAMMIGIPILLILLVAGGLFATGMIKLPGATPPPKATAKADPAPTDKELAPPLGGPPKAATVKPPAAATDPAKGAAALADLWNQLDTDTLLKVTKDWKDPELVAVLSQMDEGKVAAYITAVAKTDAPHASKLNKQLEQQASVVDADAQ